jgi:very-short-patch-repair endonuclease
VARPRTWTPPPEPFTLAHVAPLGVTAAMIRRAEQSGAITRLTHGVHIATDALPDDATAKHVQLALAVQLRNPNAIASHHTAALAWGLDLADERAAAAAKPAFVSPAGALTRSRTGDEFTIVPRDLPVQHRVEHPSGLRVTTRHRTAVDVAATLPLPEALITLDCTVRMDLHEQVGQRRLRAAHADPRRMADAHLPLIEAARFASTLRTRRHLTDVIPLADPRRESANESLSFGHIVTAGLPTPDLQVRIPTPEGDMFPDFLWAEAMVIGEADGAVKYTSREALVREKLRQEVLEHMGFRVVRWMYDDIRGRPGWVIARLVSALEARGAM